MGVKANTDPMADCVDYVTRNLADNILVIGPTVLTENKAGKKEWYFVVSGCDKDRGFRSDTIVAGNGLDKDKLRAGFILKLIGKRRLMIHDTDDELYAIRLCETLWPCEKTTRIRKAIEAERA
jgi:hypothetical protein